MDRDKPDRDDPLDVAAAMSTVAHDLKSGAGLETVLESLVRGAVHALPDIDHAGISVVHRDGGIENLAATDALVRDLDDLQYTLVEGPCVDAVRESPVVSVQHARHEQRWPRYLREAVSRGLRSQLGLRLYTDDGTIGVLNLYSTSSDTLTDEVRQMAELFSAYATMAMGRAQGEDSLNGAIASRQVIGQATGIVMERYSLTEARAFEYLLRVSSLTNVKLRDLARSMVDGRDLDHTEMPTDGGGTDPG